MPRRAAEAIKGFCAERCRRAWLVCEAVWAVSKMADDDNNSVCQLVRAGGAGNTRPFCGGEGALPPRSWARAGGPSALLVLGEVGEPGLPAPQLPMAASAPKLVNRRGVTSRRSGLLLKALVRDRFMP